MPSFRVAIVAAVSTPSQAAEDRESIPEQLADCRQACQQHGWRVEREIVIPGHSREYWSLDDLCHDCAEYRALVDLIEAEAVNLVVCMRLARLCRTVSLLTQLTDVMTRHQCQVYSVREPQEPLPPDKVRRRRGIRGVLDYFTMALSEEEQQIRVERLHQGMTRRIKAGLPAQSRLGQYGYDPAPSPTDLPTINEEQAHWVRWMYEHRARGWGYDRIAAALRERGVRSARGGEWYGPAVRHVLTNPLYKAEARWGDVTNPDGRWEPIVSVDLWERANAIPRASHRSNPRALTGIAKCGYCGLSMCYSVSPRQAPLLRCTLYTKSFGQRCRANYHTAAPIEAYVVERVRAICHDPAQYAAVLTEQADAVDVAALQTNRDRLAHAMGRWNRLYEMGDIDRLELLEHRERLEAQIAGIDRLLAEARRVQQRHAHAEAHLAGLGALLDDLEDLEPSELNEVLRLLIARVEIAHDVEPRIVWI